MSEARLPRKKDVALALLAGPSVFVHVDPRGDGVIVPSWFKKQHQLILQIGLNLAVPIPDLEVGDEGVTCTLSFSGRPFWCHLPWSAVYGLFGEDRRGMIWPEDVPAEVAAKSPLKAVDAKKPKRRPMKLVDASARAGDDRDEPEGAAQEEAASPPAPTPLRAVSPLRVVEASTADLDAERDGAAGKDAAGEDAGGEDAAGEDAAGEDAGVAGAAGEDAGPEDSAPEESAGQAPIAEGAAASEAAASDDVAESDPTTEAADPAEAPATAPSDPPGKSLPPYLRLIK